MKTYRVIMDFSTWDVNKLEGKRGETLRVPQHLTQEAANRLVTLNLLEEIKKTEEK